MVEKVKDWAYLVVVTSLFLVVAYACVNGSTNNGSGPSCSEAQLADETNYPNC